MRSRQHSPACLPARFFAPPPRAAPPRSPLSRCTSPSTPWAGPSRPTTWRCRSPPGGGGREGAEWGPGACAGCWARAAGACRGCGGSGARVSDRRSPPACGASLDPPPQGRPRQRRAGGVDGAGAAHPRGHRAVPHEHRPRRGAPPGACRSGAGGAAAAAALQVEAPHACPASLAPNPPGSTPPPGSPRARQVSNCVLAIGHTRLALEPDGLDIRARPEFIGAVRDGSAIKVGEHAGGVVAAGRFGGGDGGVCGTRLRCCAPRLGAHLPPAPPRLACLTALPLPPLPPPNPHPPHHSSTSTSTVSERALLRGQKKGRAAPGRRRRGRRPRAAAAAPAPPRPRAACACCLY
jgi:hypothetical protein